jgi:hypothetical protein
MSDPVDTRIYFDPPVTEPRAFAASKGEKTKDGLSKLAKLVPGEILGAYGAALGTLPLFSSTAQPWVALACFLLGIVGTGMYVGWRIGAGIKKQSHLLVYMAAFAVWAYSLTGKTALPWIYYPGVAALLPIVAGVAFYRIPLPKKEVR